MNMKKTGKLLSLLLALCTLALCACTITYPDDTPTDTQQPTVTEPSLRSSTIRREASRCSSGCWAIRRSGRSK